jgi:hypothetical protein
MNHQPDVLYHYTTQPGILGILQNDSIWATKIHYLNDSSEYRLTFDIALDFLKKFLKDEKSKKKCEKINCLISNLKTIEHLNVCVCSFSAQRDLLSQWRAYTEGITGFSIGFHTDNLVKQATLQDFALVQCVYNKGEQRNLVEELILNSLKQDFNTIPSRIDPSRPRTIIALPTGGDFALNISRLAPVIKSHAFHEEAEWRLVSIKGINVKNMAFRPGKSMITPYIPIKLGSDKSAYLESITVGPTPSVELSQLSISSLTAHWGVAQQVRVLCSEASYRNW